MAQTLHEWSSEGFSQNQGQSFAQEISSLHGLKAFLSALPYWCDKYDTGVILQLLGQPGAGGMGVDLAFSKRNLPPAAAQEFIDLVQQHNHLNELQLVIDKMKNLGVDPQLINVLVDEANDLAQKIKDNF